MDQQLTGSGVPPKDRDGDTSVPGPVLVRHTDRTLAPWEQAILLAVLTLGIYYYVENVYWQ